MLIIKPYGRSQTLHVSDSPKTRERQRLPKGAPNPEGVQGLNQHSEFVIAQWISVIDKIIKKSPARKNESKVTAMQFKARKALGIAALQRIESQIGKLNPTLAQAWDWKLHPYDCNSFSNSTDKDQITGRFYIRFVGQIKPNEINSQTASAIAQKIHDHLYEHALRPMATKATHGKGHVENQFASIELNVHALHNLSTDSDQHDNAVWNSYFDKGDVVAAIHQALAKQSTPKSKNSHPPHSAIQQPRLTQRATIAKHLYDHYGKVFGQQTPIKALLIINHPQHKLWLVHKRIKATYKALFDNASQDGLKHLHNKLPRDRNAMEQLVLSRHNNQDLSHLIRLGKVLHYEAAARKRLPSACWDDIKQSVKESPFWLSDGQAEIKRSEAMVRSFKLAVTYAAHTLTQLSNWQGDKDIFSNADRAAHQIDPHELSDHMALLFGRTVDDLFPSSFIQKSEMQCLLKQSVQCWANLRHATFHFKGKKGFLEQLQAGLSTDEINLQAINDVSANLWHQDLRLRQTRITASLQAAHCLDYLTQQQLCDVHQAIAIDRSGSTLDLPRLNRVLTRAKNTNLKIKLAKPGNPSVPLPDPAKREALQKSNAKHCQYVLLKLLYEKDFPRWLQSRTPEMIAGWIKRSICRSSKAAQDLNRQDSRQAIQAKAAKLMDSTLPPHFASPANANQSSVNPISNFFHELAAATASEFRVQRHYESDPVKAQQQSAFIDDLKCDVVARAFLSYLVNKWLWLLQDLAMQVNPSTLEGLTTPPPSDGTTHCVTQWQQRLYYLLHMIPVGVVSQLLHQLRKWHVLSGQGPTSLSQDANTDDQALFLACQQVMVLYLDMHDTKFDGGTPVQLNETSREPLAKCFEREADFQACFPQIGSKNGAQDAHIPLRGLREMLRFGGAKPLVNLFQSHPITHEDIAEWTGLQEKIEAAQTSREDLHKEWVDEEHKAFKGYGAYANALEICTKHRHLAHRIRLVDHLQLHGLLMAVLSRLADYASLWERDLYFVCLALCYHKGEDPNTTFDNNGDGCTSFNSGQIVKALRNACRHQSSIMADVRRLFGLKANLVDIRNDLSHFNMLRSDAPIDLTHWVNQTRTLMAYDRKLKNAVSKSIVELLIREGLLLKWNSTQHALTLDRVASKTITHLRRTTITEPQHSNQFCAMVHQLFQNSP